MWKLTRLQTFSVFQRDQCNFHNTVIFEPFQHPLAVEKKLEFTAFFLVNGISKLYAAMIMSNVKFLVKRKVL